MNIKILWPLAAGLTLAACQPQSTSQVKDAWNEANNPVIMMAVKNEFETKFSKLPAAGRPSKMPWSDHYWPTYHGGLTYRWADAKTKRLDKAVSSSSDRQFAGQLDDNETLQTLRSEVLGYVPYTKEQLASLSASKRKALIATLSPAEKLDIYRGAFDYPTVTAERERTDILATLRTLPGSDNETFSPNESYVEGKKIPTWFGLCHAWAPATVLFEEPGPITLESKDGFEVPMAGSDVKALLTYVLDVDPSQQGTRTFLAERCNNDLGETAQGELSALIDGLVPGSLEQIDTQIAALEKLSKYDAATNLSIASYFYNFAPSQDEAKVAFQKLFERMQNRYRSGTSMRNKLGSVYSASLKNFPHAGKAEELDKAKLKEDAINAVKISACNDTNAGAFHLVVSNVMGVQQKTFLIDITRDAEVWNQAAASYKSKVLKSYTGAQISADAAPGTVKEHLIETELLYTTEEMPAWERFGDNASLRKHHVPAGDVYEENGKRYRALRYRIELDALDNIIGGSWVSESRPDFLWGTGNFIWSKEFTDIEDIYYQSL